MTEKRKIYFRADAGPEIGYGHYIRSLALADMLKQDFDCTMFTQAPTDYQLREAEEVCNVVALPSNDSRFEKFLDYLTGEEIVVLDNYFFTTDYQRAIKAKGCKLVCIDDMHDKHYVADVVINHGDVTKDCFNAELYTQYCLGPKYYLLRRPFMIHPKGEHKKGVYTICFGGSDPLNLTNKYLNILQDRHIEYVYTVVGDGYQFLESLLKNRKVNVLQSLSAQQMAKIFLKSETIICAASSICIEALACGCNVHAGYYVENQKPAYEYLKNNNWITPLGDMTKNQYIPFHENSRNNSSFIVTDEIIKQYIKAFTELSHKS